MINEDIDAPHITHNGVIKLKDKDEIIYFLNCLQFANKSVIEDYQKFFSVFQQRIFENSNLLPFIQEKILICFEKNELYVGENSF